MVGAARPIESAAASAALSQRVAPSSQGSGTTSSSPRRAKAHISAERGYPLIYTKPSPALIQIVERDDETRKLVMIALAWGLRYYKYPVKLVEDLQELEVDVSVITEEVDRQLAEMPSHLYH